MKPRRAIFLVSLMGLSAFALGHMMTKLRAQAWTETTLSSLSSAPSKQASSALDGVHVRLWNQRATPRVRTIHFQELKDGRVSPKRRLDPTDRADRHWAYAWIHAQQGERLMRLGKWAYLLRVQDENVRALRFSVETLPVPNLTTTMYLVGALCLLLWILLVYQGQGRGSIIAGGALFASAWLGCIYVAFTSADAARIRLIGMPDASPPIGDVSLVFAAVLCPIVIAVIVGAINHGRGSSHREAYAYLTPAVIGMLVLVFVPFLLGVGLAFTRYTGGAYEWVGLDNFVSILSNEGLSITHPLSFYFTLGVTVLWTAINVFFHASIGLCFALILNRPQLRFKSVYRVLLIIPWAVPSYITALVWHGMFDSTDGVINQVLHAVGLSKIAWFDHFWTGFSANVITNTWLGFPFMMVVSLGALQSIPKDLYEAAEVDGASRWQAFRSITIPMLRPALLPAIILGAVWTFNMFNVIYLVSGGAPSNSTDILITEAYRWAFEKDRYGYAASYSLLIFVILLMYSYVTQRIGAQTKEAAV